MKRLVQNGVTIRGAVLNDMRPTLGATGGRDATGGTTPGPQACRCAARSGAVTTSSARDDDPVHLRSAPRSAARPPARLAHDRRRRVHRLAPRRAPPAARPARRLDDLATGSRRNLREALAAVPPADAALFRFREGDIRDAEACARALEGMDVVLHQAGLGSVPRSIADPLRTHDVNVTVAQTSAEGDADVYRAMYQVVTANAWVSPAAREQRERPGERLALRRESAIRAAALRDPGRPRALARRAVTAPRRRASRATRSGRTGAP